MLMQSDSSPLQVVVVAVVVVIVVVVVVGGGGGGVCVCRSYGRGLNLHPLDFRP